MLFVTTEECSVGRVWLGCGSYSSGSSLSTLDSSSGSANYELNVFVLISSFHIPKWEEYEIVAWDESKTWLPILWIMETTVDVGGIYRLCYSGHFCLSDSLCLKPRYIVSGEEGQTNTSDPGCPNKVGTHSRQPDSKHRKRCSAVGWLTVALLVPKRDHILQVLKAVPPRAV